MASRAAQALALRLAGVDWNTIVDRLNYPDISAAVQDVTEAADEQYDGVPLDPLRVLEVLRFDRLQAAIWSAAMKGDLAAVNAALSIGDRRARMLRLYLRSERGR